MKNVNIKVEGSQIIITLDGSREFGRSKSGKTIIVASTEGNKVIQLPSGEEVRIGLNVYKYPPRKK